MSIFKNITLTIRIRSIDGWMDGRKEGRMDRWIFYTRYLEQFGDTGD